MSNENSGNTHRYGAAAALRKIQFVENAGTSVIFPDTIGFIRWQKGVGRVEGRMRFNSKSVCNWDISRSCLASENRTEQIRARY